MYMDICTLLNLQTEKKVKNFIQHQPCVIISDIQTFWLKSPIAEACEAINLHVNICDSLS